MSIRMIAQELYRLHQDVERLKKEMENSPFEMLEQIKERLRKLTAERDRMKGLIEGAKELPSYRKPL